MNLKKNTIFGLVLFALVSGGMAQAAVELAKVGGKTITDQDVKEKLGGLPEAQKNYLNKDPNARERLIENLVMEELFVQEAEKMGISKKEDFKQALENSRRQLLVRSYIKEKVDNQISPKKVSRYFNSNKIRYRTDQVKASHILVKTEAEAKEVYEKAKKAKDMKEFQELAKKYSKDPSVQQNMGDLGYFPRSGRMIKEFADVAFKMDKGQISEPVKTMYGWHVIKVEDKKKGKNAKFDAVKRTVERDLRNDLMTDLVENLKKENKVSTNKKNIGSITF